METLLIVGTGDVASRLIPAALERYRVFALTRDRFRADQLAARGVGPIVGDLDDPASLAPLTGLADRVVHLAPPTETGTHDMRTRALLSVLSKREMVAQGSLRAPCPRRLVYISTTGVYGDCGGERIDETRPANPGNDRARRRVDAERAVADWAPLQGTSLAVLRVPGIYAADRLPVERLRKGTPALRPEDDVFTNHIHADDLAAIVLKALERDDSQGIFNTTDDTEMKMGDYFDLVADRFALPRPPRISRAEARERIPPALLSFMSESRRIGNARMKAALGVVLRYPTVYEGVPFADKAST
jgi:nucleoside-diphosphate-sugar epimerase